MLAVPEIGVGDDKPRLRGGDGHAPPLFLEHVVEGRMPRIHARRADGPDLFIRKLRSGEAVPGFPEAPEFLVFIRADEVAGDLAVARDGDGCALGLHPVATEVPGELGAGTVSAM